METVNCLRCDFHHKDNGNCTAVGGILYGGTGCTLPDVAEIFRYGADAGTCARNRRISNNV